MDKLLAEVALDSRVAAIFSVMAAALSLMAVLKALSGPGAP
jgi:hypothetical protein